MRQAGFGLLLEAPVLLPGLSASQDNQPPDLVILPDESLDTSAQPDAWYQTAVVNEETGEPILQVHRPAPGAPRWRIRYGDGTTFRLSAALDELRFHWRPPYTLEDAATYLLGPVLGFVLHKRGVTALHASAVEIDGRAVAFAADAGMGKSTTAAAFARAGHRVLTDDVCALFRRDGAFFAQPSYPRVRLWPPSVVGLYEHEDALPKLTPNWDKRGLDLDDAHRSEPAPLTRVFLLAYNDGDDLPRFRPAAGQEALLHLVRHVYGRVLADEEDRARDFDLLADLVARVPVTWLTLRDDLGALDEVVARVSAFEREQRQEGAA